MDILNLLFAFITLILFAFNHPLIHKYVLSCCYGPVSVLGTDTEVCELQRGRNASASFQQHPRLQQRLG